MTTDATTGAPRNEATNAVCSVCKWTNTGLLNLGVFGTPRWVCHSCCATLASERDSFRDEAKRLRDLLERALPVLKHRAVDGSAEAEALVGEVQRALAGDAVRSPQDSGSPRVSAAANVRRFLNGELSEGKLLELVPQPRDLVGVFANMLDECRGARASDGDAIRALRADVEDLRAQRDCYLASRESYRLERDSLVSRCAALRADVARLREALERVADVHPWQSSASQAGQMSAIARDALAATAHDTGVAASDKERAS